MNTLKPKRTKKTHLIGPNQPLNNKAMNINTLDSGVADQCTMHLHVAQRRINPVAELNVQLGFESRLPTMSPWTKTTLCPFAHPGNR